MLFEIPPVPLDQDGVMFFETIIAETETSEHVGAFKEEKDTIGAVAPIDRDEVIHGCFSFSWLKSCLWLKRFVWVLVNARYEFCAGS
ncbi:hypothetical protein [Pseudomonas sp. IAC-BECa141]|uniref:hypothetical protein n=1 Tax=Pseudomonas sp. IAC-BECa141 TaxID=2793103 RepID=UPI001D0820BB|nr:hypothetical protein [Pseudomonas sp. IAC-BECa141]UDI91298.1 hypothetical protein I5961_19370 [Pseudomonas sp. IAC-BECa141]